jgi:hypothetical protein
MPELEEPSYITPAQGLAFLAQLAQMRSEQNAARQNLELKLHDADLRAQWSLAEKDRQLEAQERNYESLDRARQAKADRDELTADLVQLKAQRESQRSEDLIAFNRGLQELDPQLGTNKWITNATMMKGRYANLMGSQEGVRLWNSYFNANKVAMTSGRQAEKDSAAVLEQLAFGKTGSHYFDPSEWGLDETTKKHYRALDNQRVPIPPKAKTGQEVISGGGSFQHLDPAEWDALTKLSHDLTLRAQRSYMDQPGDPDNIPGEPIHDYDLGTRTVRPAGSPSP